MKRLRFAAWLWLALAGCPAPAPPSPNPPGPAPVVGCVRACDHVERDLGCPVSPDCAEVCERVGDPKFTACVGAAASCGAVDRCDVQ